MTWLTASMTLFCVCMIAIGQILFKLAARKIPTNLELSNWVGFIFSPIFISSLALYGVATFLWIFTLKKTSLSVAYPFMALAFVIVPILSYFFLNEKISTNTMIGTVFIIIGLIITTR